MRRALLLLATLLFLIPAAHAQLPNQWQPAQGGTTSATLPQGAAPNSNVITVAGSCGVQTNCFQTNANTQQDNVASWSPSNGNITIAGTGNSFCNNTTVACAAGKVTSVGMTAWGTTQCRSDTSSVIEVPIGTISSVTSATVAVINTTPTTTRTASGCFTWGNYDDTALAAAETQADATAVCPSIILSAGMYLIQNQHFKTQPASCARIPNVQSASNLGGFGFAWGGVGEGATRVVISPAFTANSTVLGNAGISMQGMWLHDFSMDCGGDYNSAWTSSNNAAGLVNLGTYSKMSNVSLASCASLNTHVPGVAYQNPAHMSYVTIDSFGGTCLRNNGTANMYLDHSAIQDCQASYNSEAPQTAAVVSIVSGGVMKSVGGNFFGAGTSTSTDIIYVASGGVVYLTSSDFDFDNGNTFLCYGISNAGGVENFGAVIAVPDCSTSSSAVNNLSGGLFISYGGGLQSNASGVVAVVQNAGTWQDESWTNFVGGNARMSGAGTVYKDSSASVSPLVTGNVVLSACGTSTAGTFGGSTRSGFFTITFAGTAVTTCTATITFPVPFLAGSTVGCSMQATGGTNTFPANITNGTISATSAAFTLNYTAAWTAANTQIVRYTCSNP